MAKGKKDKTVNAPPKMRGYLNARIRVNLIAALTLSALSGIAFRIFYVNARRKRYAEFYKTYDPEEHFERMRKAGLMQSTMGC